MPDRIRLDGRGCRRDRRGRRHRNRDHLAIERGWLELHDSGTFVRFTQSGADLFA